MKVFKLENRKVVVSENGVSKVCTAPSGVSFSEAGMCWNAWVIDPVTNCWKGLRFSVKKHGAIEAFKMAVQAREESLSFLLTRRLLPRIRKQYEYRQIGDFFMVRDPLAKKTRKFATLKDAVRFNTEITDEWKLTYTFNKASMIEIQRGFKAPKLDAFTAAFQKAEREQNARLH